MPPRRNRFGDDPYYQIYRDINTKEDGSLAPGFMQHRDISEYYEQGLDLDPMERRQFWADYNLYMVSDRTGVRRNSVVDNPFWEKWNIDPTGDDGFDWHSWREAMGYPHGGRR